MSCYQI